MAKSRDAFRTISEVAEWLDTPAHVLRFWESKFSQVKPVKRAGGRRYYRPSDMELLGGIKRLLHEDGMTIKGVQKVLREKGVKHVAALSPGREALYDDVPALEAEADSAASDAIEDAPFAHVDEAETVVPFQSPRTEEPAQETPQATTPSGGEAAVAAEDEPGRDDADLVAGSHEHPPVAEDAAAMPGAPEPGPKPEPDAQPAFSHTAPEDVPEIIEAAMAGEDTPEAAAFEDDSAAEESPLPSFLQKPLADTAAEVDGATAADPAPEPEASPVEEMPATHTADEIETIEGAVGPEPDPEPPIEDAATGPETHEVSFSIDTPEDADSHAAEDAPDADTDTPADSHGDVEAAAADAQMQPDETEAEPEPEPEPQVAALVPDREVPDDPDIDALDVARGPLGYLPLSAPLSPEQVQALGPLVRRLQTLVEHGAKARTDS